VGMRVVVAPMFFLLGGIREEPSQLSVAAAHLFRLSVHSISTLD